MRYLSAMTPSAIADSIVGVFSPKRALLRQVAREKMKYFRAAQYAAAKTDRLTGSWSPGNDNVNSIISGSSANVRSRVRQLVRDFPYFARAVDKSVEYVVGDGIKFQSRVQNAEEKLDKKRIQSVEDAFNFWADESDISGKLHYYEIMQLAKRQDIEAGEFLIIKVKPKKKTYLPYALQIIEPDWLTDNVTNPFYTSSQKQQNTITNSGPGSQIKTAISQGIEFDTATGEVIGYHFTDPDGWGSTTRVRAEDVIHGFQTLRPGQLRGITPFASGVLLAHDLQDYMDSEIDRAKMAAKYLAIVKTPDITTFQADRVETDPDTQKKIEEMENAIIEYLRPGEEITLTTNPNPGSNFPPFVKLVLTMLSISSNVPYELVSGDYSEMNYSTGRLIRMDYAHQLRPIAVRHVRQFCFKTFYPFMDMAVLNGKLDLPGYFTNPIPWLKSDWQPPGMESVDPLRETKSKIDEIKSGIRSPQETTRARGRDLEEVYREIAQAKDMAAELGLTFEDTSTALANNPAALDVDNDEGGTGDERKVLTFKGRAR